jgi:ADP-heptose:LPS heptosyltransferase
MYGKPEFIITWGKALGDNLLLTSPIKYIYGHSKKRQWVLSYYPELFRYNKKIICLKNNDRGEERIISWLKLRLLQPNYSKFIDKDTEESPENHIIRIIAKQLGIKEYNEVPLEIDYKFHPKEIFELKGKPRIVIQSNSNGAKLFIANKQWYPERFQEVVDYLSPHFEMVQVGSPLDIYLDGCVDFRGKTTVRESIAIIESSRLFIGLVGFYMHAAKAVGTKSLIIYGGREHPDQSGYTENINVYSATHCSPCWKWNNCDYMRKCMQEITFDTVKDKLDLVILDKDKSVR